MLCRGMDEVETDQHIRNLRAYGFTKIEEAMTPDALQRARREIAALESEASGSDGADVKTRGIVFNIQNQGKFFIDLVSAPAVHAACKPFLNDPYYDALPADAPNYTLAYYTARSSQEDSPLPLHIDSIIPAPGERTWAMQAVFMLDDQTIDNGCSVVVPGSHLSGRYTDREMDQTVPVESKAGDVVIWDSRLWHGALPNKVGTPRWALIATFHMWWIKQKMDIPRMLPQNIYAELTDEQKQLLGYCAIPPSDHTVEINTKLGYEALKPTVADYFK